MKLSKKQKEVIGILRKGTFIHWIGGIYPMSFIAGNNSYRLSVSTCLALENLGLLKRDSNHTNCKFYLTDLGKTIEI